MYQNLKIDSKFHIHVPYVKINQLRVELDNLESEFVGQDSKMFKDCIFTQRFEKQRKKYHLEMMN